MDPRSPGLRTAVNPAFAFLPDGGEAGALVRALDWARHPLGPPSGWPDTLKTTLGILYGSRHPMFLFWGPELICFYNDAYLPSIRMGKHPSAMGARGKDVWPEIWGVIGPQIDDVMVRGKASWNVNQFLPIERNGKLEDVYWTYSYSPVRQPDGTVAGTLVVCSETTSEVLNERALRESEARLQRSEEQLLSVTHAVPDLISYLDPDHRYRFVNAAYERWFGATLTELVGKPLRDFVGGGVYRQAKPHLDRAFRGETVEFTQEAPYPSGTRHIRVVYSPDRDSATGQVRGVVALVHDASEQIAMQKALDESRAEALRRREVEIEKLGRLFDQAPTPLAMLEGPEHRFLFANEIYRERFIPGRGYAGKPAREVLPEAAAQGFIALLDGVYRSGERFIGNETRMEIGMPGGGTREFFFNFVYEPMRDPGGEVFGVLAAITDVTQQVRGRRKLELERDLREGFVAAMSHDLRTPLTAAKMNAQLLGRKLEEPVQVRKLAGRIADNMDRADQMIQDILDASRIKAGEEVHLDLGECELGALAASVVEDFSTVHGDRFVIRAGEPVHGRWDSSAIRRVIENLVGNAVKYGSPTEPVTISMGQDGEGARITVHNSGAPIPEALVPHLFEAYRRADSAGQGKTKGWGLGLTLVRGLTEAHGGSVSVRSSAAEGTDFTVRLPLGTKGPSRRPG